MIQNKTARELMYSWHGGQFSAFYAAASSGLVESFDALLNDCETLKDDPNYPEDYMKLKTWIEYRKKHAKHKVIVCGTGYFILPWVSRSY